MVVSLLCVGGWTCYDSRQAARRQAEQHEGNIALSVRDEIAQLIGGYDQALQVAIQGLHTPNLANLDPAIRQAILFNRADATPESDGIIIADETGRVIYTSRHLGTDPTNVANRPHFEVHRQNPGLGLVFSTPIRSVLDDAWIIGFSRRINHPDGSFAGAVMGRIPLTLFRQIFDRFDIGKADVITLTSTDGPLIARRPFRIQDIGRDMSGSVVLRRLATEPAGSLELTATVDNIPRLYTYRKVADLPFVVAVGFPTSEIYAEWFRKTAVVALLLLSLMFIATTAILALVNEFGRRGLAEAAATETNIRLETLTRHLARSRDQARQANTAKSRFLASITHELRTPLNGILGYAQLLSLEGGLSETQATRVRAMQNAGEHLLGMISAVLDLSQIEADRLEMQPLEIDLPSLTRVCLDVVSPGARAKGLALTMCVAPGTPGSVVADPLRLRQVLVNLLGNAVKFTSAGHVEVLLRPSAHDAVRIEVSDTGPGIALLHRDKLFQEFERVHDESLGAVEGSGLGLAITSRLVQRMGGQIGYSENAGGGSIFWIEFPASVSAAVSGDKAAPGTPAPVARASARILVVDDVAMNRDVAAALLGHAGHQTVCVDGGEAAVAAVAADDFDIVLMDVRMPGVDGLEATRRIRALPGRQRQVPILALTAQAFSDQIQKCTDAGMNGHVGKPIEQGALLAAIANVLAPQAPAVRQGDVPPAQDEPLLDHAVYHQTAQFLPSAQLETHLRTLVARAEALITMVGAAMLGVPTPDLATAADAAHAVGGAASTLGFRRLAATARRFEAAVESGDANTAVYADRLLEAVRSSVALMRKLLVQVDAPAMQD